MEYSQEEFYRMTGGGSQKMPFYMTYPMQNMFLEEAEYERDMERLRGMYPEEVRELLGFVEEECDKMEHEGSLMFDEYPDRLMLRRIGDQIYDRVALPLDFEAEQYEPVEAEELKLVGQQRDRGGRPPEFGPPPGRPPHNRPDQGVRNLIDVLLFNEMHNRRCRHRRCRRWW